MKTSIKRRVSVLCKLVIFLVVTEFSDIFTVRHPNSHSNNKQGKRAKKDYYKASESVLKIGNLLLSNRVQQEFHTNSFKMSL